MKSMNKDREAFQYLRSKFPGLGDAKNKEGIFMGPQIYKTMKGSSFDKILEGKEKIARDAFKSVIRVFLGSKKMITISSW